MRLFFEAKKSHISRILDVGFSLLDDPDETRKYYGFDGVELSNEISASKPTAMIVEVDVKMAVAEENQWEICRTDSYCRSFFVPLSVLNALNRNRVPPSLVKRWYRWTDRRMPIP